MGQLACRIQQREVFLVRLHGENQALLRDTQELLFKFADQHVRALDQGRDFVQQSLVVDRPHTAADFRRRRLQLALNFSAALGKAGDHRAIVLEQLGILVGMREHQGRDFGFKAMALGAVASRQAQGLDRHHVAAVQRDQAVCRAHKMHAAPARKLAIGFQLVLHDFGDGQLGERFFQGFLQSHLQARALDHAVVEQGFGPRFS